MTINYNILGVCALATLLLSSCAAKQSPDYNTLVHQEQQLVESWQEQEEAEEVTLLSDLISSSQLDALITEALKANPDLYQTALTLDILRAQRLQVRADRLPGVALDLGGSKTEGEDESYSGSLDVSWELDLWQKLKDSEDAASLDARGQEATLEAARASLAATVMQQWLTLIYDRKTIAIEEQRLENLEKNETYILQRYRGGIGSLEDLDSARSTTHSSRATLEEYRENLKTDTRTLATLLGKARLTDFEFSDRYPEVILPLAELPEQTLQKRPDLQAAYLAILAADKRSSVAYKELLPSISIGAALEDISDSPSSLILTDPLWSLLGQLTAPLFQGGKLKAAAHIAELETAQSYQAYREVLITAVTEVDTYISQEKSLARQQTHIKNSLNSAVNSLQRYQESYRAGLVDILDLLTVQQKTFDLYEQLNNLEYAQLVNRTQLGLALGLGV